MKIQKCILTNFKRFTKLKLTLPSNSPKLVVLVGPNGCGKSSIFDAFEQVGGKSKGGLSNDQTYYRKNLEENFLIEIDTDQGPILNNNPIPTKAFYSRSAYRHEADFVSTRIDRKDEILLDSIRPKRMIEPDARVKDNYERLVAMAVRDLFSKTKDELTVPQLRENILGRVRSSMLNVFPDLMLEGMGDPVNGGQFFFTKGVSENFPYKNISAGEKAAFDLLLDLVIKTEEFNDTVFTIDEPELHMHSSLQTALLNEIFSLLPDTCQLWVATHSIGFIKGAVKIGRNNSKDVCIFDFTNLNFDDELSLDPIVLSKGSVRKIFSVALDDLASMVTPSTIVICEGSINAPATSPKRDFDTEIYSIIFENEDIGFVSGDSKSTAQKAGRRLLDIIKSSGAVRRIFSLVDRDELTDEQIAEFQAADHTQLFLGRREIENYLFDSEIIKLYCASVGVDPETITNWLVDPVNSDGKEIQGALVNQCNFSGTVDDFKKTLASFIVADTDVYRELKAVLFPDENHAKQNELPKPAEG